MLRMIETKKRKDLSFTEMSTIYGSVGSCPLPCGCFTNCGSASTSDETFSLSNENSGMEEPP